MNTRIKIYAIALTWCFILACVRIGVIVTNPKYTSAEASQSYATVEIAKSRGTIYDTDMKPLTNTDSYYKAAVVSNPQTVTRLSEILTATKFNEVIEYLKTGKPTVVNCNKYFEADGAYVHPFSEYYSSGNVIAPHLLGYLNGDGDGVSGIEKAYNQLLKSNDSLKVSFCLDARGQALSGVSPIIRGEENYNTVHGVVTTLKSEIQTVVEESVKDKITAGAALVMNLTDGAILASASMPDYSVTDVASSLKADNSPLVNRAFGAYNVGSVFKICVAAAALESGISEQKSFTCKGYVDVGNTRYWCNNKSAHGKLDMKGALCKSCNTYFIKLALEAGAQSLYSMASAMGFGNKINFGNGLCTSGGNLPELSVLLSNYGELANFAFGQGELMATPVHICSMASCIASGGLYSEPYLIKGTVDNYGEFSCNYNKPPRRIMSQSTADSIKEMMTAVVTDGTGKNAYVKNVSTAGKTATAETGWYKDGRNVTQAWFVGFAPADRPKYAIVVLAEDGISGAVSAAPVFSDIVSKLNDTGLI